MITTILITVYAVLAAVIATLMLALPSWGSSTPPWYEAVLGGLLWPLAIPFAVADILWDKFKSK